MMKKFKNIIGNKNDWDTKVLASLKEFFGDKTPEFMDDSKTFYSQNQIFKLFKMNYDEFVVRYSSEQLFLNALILCLLDNLPKLYVSALAFVNDEFQKLLQDENRGTKVVENINSLSKTKNKQGVPPTNLTVSDDLRNLNIKNAEYLENALDNQHVVSNTNLLMNLKSIISSNINGIVLDWLKNFTFLFSTLITTEIDEIVKDNLQDEFYDIKSNFINLQKEIDSTNSSLSETNKNIDNINNLLNANSDADKTLTAKVLTNTANISTLDSSTVKISGNQDINDTKKFTSQTIFANNNTLVKIGKGGYQNTMTGIEFSNSGTIGVWNDASNQLQISTFADGVRFNTKVSSTVEPTESNNLTTKNYVDNAIRNVNDTTETNNKINEIKTSVNNLDSKLSNTNSNVSGLTSSVNTLNNWTYSGNSCTGFYLDGQITSHAYYTMGNNYGIITYYTDISYSKNFVNACIVGVCLRAYDENNSFGITEIWISNGKLAFKCFAEGAKAVDGVIRLFFLKNKYY